MATESKLKEDIKKLETAINGKAPEKLKAKFKNQLAILKTELSALQKPAASKMSRAKQLRAKYKALYGVRFQGIDIEKDADIPAMRIGRRVSQGIKGNQYASKKQAKGNVYYEYRENRIDMKQPPKKYPKLEDGGMMAKGGNLPSSLQKRLDNLKGRVNITKSKALEAYEMHNDKGMGGSSVGYELFKAENKRDSQTFGDLAIDLGRYYSGKKADKTEDAKLLDSKEHGGYMAKGGNLIGKQKNLDVNKNGKLDAEDFKMLRGEKMAKGGESKSSKVNFYDIVDSIKYLEYDGDPSDLRLFSDERFNWGADNPEDYEKAEKEIDNIKYKGNGWEIYATYDGSSYSYWMESQEEQNYISIVILFQKEKIDKSEIEKIKEALQDAHDDAENIADKYDYNPSNYAKGGKTQGYDDREDERLAMKYGKMKSKYLNSTKARRDDARFEERGKMADGGMMAEGGLVVKSDEDLREIANYMAKAVKKRWDLKDLVYYFEQENNYDYKYRVKIWDEMNVYEMKKTEENIYKVLKAIVEANKGGKMADGGMMAKGGKLSKKSFLKEYEENEDQNMHSENVVLLAKNYGTESDIRDAKTILAKHESIGNLPASLREERDALHKKLYDKFRQSKEDGGMMAEGGAVNEDNMEMVVSQVKAIKHHAEELSKIITSSTPIEAWVVAKIERSETDLSDVTHYLDGLKMEHGGRVSSSQHRLNR